MKLGITNQNEISSLSKLCNEIETLSEDLSFKYFKDIDLEPDKDYYEILYPIWKESENIEEFMGSVFKQFKLIHFSRIIWNCSVLLDNCADLTLDHLDFNPKIKAGFEALDLLIEIDNNLEINDIVAVISHGPTHKRIKQLLAKVPVDEQEDKQTTQNSETN